MVIKEHGKVRDGGIVLPKRLDLSDGTDVVVHIEPRTDEGQIEAPISPEEFARLPVFGMWADREEMADSVEWVRSERERWRQRALRED
jgi:hypothetical protein